MHFDMRHRKTSSPIRFALLLALSLSLSNSLTLSMRAPARACVCLCRSNARVECKLYFSASRLRLHTTTACLRENICACVGKLVCNKGLQVCAAQVYSDRIFRGGAYVCACARAGKKLHRFMPCRFACAAATPRESRFYTPAYV